MNTVFIPWEAIETNDVRMVEINQNKVRLIYSNDAQVSLDFTDPEQLDRFLTHLLSALVCQNSSDHIRWN